VPVVMDEKLSERLTEFVRGGGLLVAEAPFAEVDASGRELAAKPGCGLDKLFGIHTGKAIRGDPGVIKTDAGAITGWEFGSKVQPDGADVIGRFADGAPAATRNRLGKGTAVYLGACASLPYGDGWAQAGLAEFLRQELDGAGLRPPFTVSHAGKGFLDVSSLADAKGNRILILTVPPANGKPQDPIGDVTIALPAEEVSALGGGAWAFRPAAQDARGAAGGVAQALTVEKVGGVARLKLGEIGSAELVLLARDAAPLIGLKAPAAAEKAAPSSP